MLYNIMNSIQKRFLLFLIGCIGTRLLLVYITKNIDKKYLPYCGVIALIPAVGFLYIFLTGKRKTGGEVFGGKIWWNKLRPVHAFLYILFAIMAFREESNAYIPLLIDVSIGLIAFIYYHFIQNNFTRLL
jgi:hypothetical protein